MKKQTKAIVFVLGAFAFALAGAARAGDLELKFDDYIKLASLTADYNFRPDIAWSGSVFAVVYSDYRYNISSSGVYLMFVDTNGNVTMSAKKSPPALTAFTPGLSGRAASSGYYTRRAAPQSSTTS
jgi:hypothetical protein